MRTARDMAQEALNKIGEHIASCAEIQKQNRDRYDQILDSMQSSFAEIAKLRWWIIGLLLSGSTGFIVLLLAIIGTLLLRYVLPTPITTAP